MTDDAPVYIFKGGALYGFTKEEDGSNLPTDECKDWKFWKQTTRPSSDDPRIGLNSKTMKSDLETLGYHISRPANPE